MNNPIIIFEGLDRVGKSSHINMITDIFDDLNKNYLTFHCEGPDSTVAKSTQERIYYQLFTFYNQLKMLKSIKNTPIIFDRSFFGEAVWSKYYNRLFDSEYEKLNDVHYLGFVVEKIMETNIFKDIKDRIILITLTGDHNIVSERIDASSEDTRIYTQFCCCNIYKNVKFIDNEFKRLHNVLTERGINSNVMTSNNESEINTNVREIFNMMNKIE